MSAKAFARPRPTLTSASDARPRVQLGRLEATPAPAVLPGRLERRVESDVKVACAPPVTRAPKPKGGRYRTAGEIFPFLLGPPEAFLGARKGKIVVIFGIWRAVLPPLAQRAGRRPGRLIRYGCRGGE